MGRESKMESAPAASVRVQPEIRFRRKSCKVAAVKFSRNATLATSRGWMIDLYDAMETSFKSY